MNPIVLIPARLESTRLPQKMIKEINGIPLIAHVVMRALEAAMGPVFVACDSPRIQEALKGLKIETILTDPALPSGSDRIYRALQFIDPQGAFDTVVNLQGDLPTFSVGTLGCPIHSEEELQNPNSVKIALAHKQDGCGEALYFSRSPIPYGPGPHFHHIGIYTYRREALERFVTLAPSPLERQEKLEQLRLLENGMRIGVGLVDAAPLSVDTAEDLAQAQRVMK
jgi:3-deoxy-manno-octulosonate cytidylyltransferase (CMP-KDO synthetase)